MFPLRILVYIFAGDVDCQGVLSSLASYLTIGKSFTLCVPQFAHLLNEGNNSASQACEDKMR